MEKNNISIWEFFNLLFYVGIFTIEFSIFAKNIIFVSNYVDLLNKIGMSILFFNIILKLLYLKTSYKNWLIVFLLVVISFFSYIKTRDYLLIQLCLFLISSIGMDFKKIVKADLFFKLLLLLLIFISYNSNLTIDNYFIRHGEIRHSFGFAHPNTFGYYIFLLMVEIIYIFYSKQSKKNLFSILILSIIAFFVVDFAKSRTIQECIIFFDLLLLLKHGLYLFKKNKKSTCSFFNSILFLIFTLLTLLSVYLFNKNISIVNKINYYLSYRLSYFKLFLDSYKITIFGNRVVLLETLDNIYIKLLINFGLIGWLEYFYIFNSIFKNAAKKSDEMISLIMIVFLVYGIMEFFSIRPIINIFLCYFTTSQFLKKGDVINEK